jgi:hypothetical protein
MTKIQNFVQTHRPTNRWIGLKREGELERQIEGLKYKRKDEQREMRKTERSFEQRGVTNRETERKHRQKFRCTYRKTDRQKHKEITIQVHCQK